MRYEWFVMLFIGLQSFVVQMMDPSHNTFFHLDSTEAEREGEGCHYLQTEPSFLLLPSV